MEVTYGLPNSKFKIQNSNLMKKIFLLLSFIFLITQAKAQSDTIEPVSSVIISDVSINTGWAASTMENFTVNDFRKLAPEGFY